MKKFRRLAALLAVVAVFCLVFAVSAHADVGNVFDDSDIGGGYDYGGGNDYSGGDTYISGSSDGGELTFGDIVITVVIVAVIVVLYAILKKLGIIKSAPAATGSSQTASAPVLAEETVIDAIRAVDPDFAAEQFKTYASDVFLRVQEAWESKDWKVVRPFESDKLFALHERQLQEFISSKKTNHMDGQNIRTVRLADYKSDGTNEVLTVQLCASLFDFTTDDTSGALIGGSKTEKRIRTYKLEFIRAAGVKTSKTEEGLTAGACPSCGAPVEVSVTGVCEYCRNVITSGKYGWVLNEYNAWH